MKTLSRYLSNPYLILFLGIICMSLGSAKWTISIGPWLGLSFFLYFTRKVKLWKSFLFGLCGIFMANLIAVYDVFPAPFPILIMILLIGSLKSILPYFIDRITKASNYGFMGTLIFPAAFVSLEYFNTLDSGDVWSSIANTQYHFKAFQQIASVFGIWGITFLIAWFASLINWMASLQWKWKALKSGTIIAGSIYLIIIVFGIARISKTDYTDSETVKIAGITMNNSNLLESIYQDEFGKSLEIPLEASQTDPKLQEANKAMVPFIENPFDKKFEKSLIVMNANLDHLFQKTAEIAEDGAKIVVWSEAIGFIINSQEDSVVERAKTLARDKGIYLFMSLGVLNPGPINSNRLLLVNKIITVSPKGDAINEYLKSNPVPFVEQEYGSDDIIPVIESPYGNLSPIICYDADFPHFLKQTVKNKTDILMVPSGDWQAIDPYHGYMASLRGIENGISVFRPVSRAVSIATDPYGNLLGSTDFYTSKDKILVARVPIQGIKTIYNHIGDLLPYLSILLTFFMLLQRLYGVFRKKKTLHNANTSILEY